MATLKPKGRKKNLFTGPNAVMPSAQGLASGLTCRKGRHSLKRCEVTELTISLFFVLPSASASSLRYASVPPLTSCDAGVLLTQRVGCYWFLEDDHRDYRAFRYPPELGSLRPAGCAFA